MKKPALSPDPTVDHDVIVQAEALFGSDAATAVAYCGIDAWLEGNTSEFEQWVVTFQRLRN